MNKLPKRTLIDIAPLMYRNDNDKLNGVDIFGEQLFAGDIITFSTRSGLSFGMLIDEDHIYSVTKRNHTEYELTDNITYESTYWYAIRKRFYSFNRCIKVDLHHIPAKFKNLYNGYIYEEVKGWEEYAPHMVRFLFADTRIINREDEEIMPFSNSIFLNYINNNTNRGNDD